MKKVLLYSSFVILHLSLAAAPAVPQAPVITYGLIRDEYGSPLMAASRGELMLVKDADRAGVVYAQSLIQETGIVGMNYRLSLEIDSAGPVRERAVTVGTPMFIQAKVGGTEVALSPVARFVTPAQGSSQRRDYSTGVDADNDSMPDAWEEWVLQLAGEDYDAEAVAAFRPDGDADGDGMTNLQEFLAGTDPFISTDIFKVLSFELIPGTDRARIRFTTTTDRKYRVVMATSLSAADWTPLAAALTQDGAPTYDPVLGTGRICELYVDARLSAMFFRIAAN